MEQKQSQTSLQPAMVANVPLQDRTYDNSAMFYGLPQYHNHHHHQPAPTNFYVPYVPFQALPSQLPSLSSDREYERNAQFMDHMRGAYKGKNAVNPQYLSTLAAPFGNPGSYPFPPHPGSIWYDRSDGSPSFWPHAPYMHESSSRNPTTFMYPSQVNPREHYYTHHHHPPALYPHMASSASYRVPPENFAHSAVPVQPTGFRLYQHHPRDDSVPVATLRHHRGGGVPRFRVMPDDEVAILEFGDFLGGSGNNHIDHHRDMRLDIEEMSYEDLLALSERIGTVNTGLPEEDVKNHLKTRTNVEQTVETEPCTICQESFKNEEKIAILDCGHEYHAKCLEKWLIVKNVCPICKSEALVMEKRKV